MRGEPLLRNEPRCPQQRLYGFWRQNGGKMYALIDSNNFFVACERLFRPDLEGVPVIVLSSNDGCAVSRSHEAKALGVAMGEPIFKLRGRFQVIESRDMSQESRKMVKRFCDARTARLGQGMPSARPPYFTTATSGKPPLVVFSANFELYGDISERIATLLTSITPHIELYSIDEAFLDLDKLDIPDYSTWGKSVRAAILKNIGIPVSVGIAPTKTLCKLANHWAKTHEDTFGVFVVEPRVTSQEARAAKLLQGNKTVAAGDTTFTHNSYLVALGSTSIADVWGVGWRLAPRLRAEGIFTALDLARMRPQRAGQLMGIHGRHMVYELGGTRCLPLQPATKAQHIIGRGRQFGADTSEESVVEAAITTLATRAARELRREGQLAAQAAVILRTNYHKPGYTRVSHAVRFYTPTANTGTICSQLIRTLHREFHRGLSYHKADVVLYDLSPSSSLQTDVFGMVSIADHTRSTALMHAVDAITAKYGPHALRPAAETLSSAWQPRSHMRSPRYTSSWRELPSIQIPHEPRALTSCISSPLKHRRSRTRVQ